MMSKLEEMLLYVSEHNDFYKNRIKEHGIKDPLDITQWPILTRKELQENRYNMFSDGYKAKYYNQQLRRQASSGSSGVPVSVYWDYKDWYASNMSLWRKRWQWYGIKPSDKYIMFTLNGFGLESRGQSFYYLGDSENLLIVNTSLLYKEMGFRRLIKKIDDFGPKWLYIQPHILANIINICEKYNEIMPKTISYIETVGEIFTNDLKEKARTFFNTPVVNMYGSEEMNCIAYENPNRQLQILDDNVYVECIGGQHENYKEAIITNLNNKSMPLIRYNQGDLIDLYMDNTEGNNLIISSIYGRSVDVIRVKNVVLSPYLFFDVIADVNNQLEDMIKEYNFVYYKSQELLRCHICLNDSDLPWLETVNNLILKALSEKLEYNKIFQIIIDCNEESDKSKSKSKLRMFEVRD